ncbi:MAG: hypothetical protein CMK49_03300 [Prochlorococcus sp. SP3034]|nr:hypothetical protein [Prochlorococcus sp. SP3034]|tara:strand:- start:2711 stop:2932 length:222 start_codon:yes stop_codon:yes gene_type:complete
MYSIFITLLFFPEWTNGLPPDFLLLHFFFGAIFIPFIMINRKARKFDRENPQSMSDGYKDFNKSIYYGYEDIQ